MALYDACGGVAPGPGDNWYEESNLTHVNELIDRGASVNFQGPGKYTPLHFAAFRGFTDICERLIECGAKVNANTKDDWTPLHLAATNGETETCKRLVQLGADLYATTVHTNLPLDEATGMQHWRTASVLKHLMGPKWFEWARQSYHANPSGQYTYDPMETITDDELALLWQSGMRMNGGGRRGVPDGPDGMDRLVESMILRGTPEDPMGSRPNNGTEAASSLRRLQIDPALRDTVGWVDDEGCYHPPDLINPPPGGARLPPEQGMPSESDTALDEDEPGEESES